MTSKDVKPASSAKPAGIRLTEREREILDLIAEGITDIGIGDKLKLSPKTINYHVEDLKKRLNVNTRMQVIVTALRQRWIY